MTDTVISVENLSKHYHLGVIGSHTLRDDAARWWAKLRGQPDPTLKIGQSPQSPVPSPQSPIPSGPCATSPSTSSRAKSSASLHFDRLSTSDCAQDRHRAQRRGQEYACFDPSTGSGHRKLNTSLKILSRITAPSSGHVRVKGRIASLLEVRVPSGRGFHPELTGRENIYLNGAILGNCGMRKWECGIEEASCF